MELGQDLRVSLVGDYELMQAGSQRLRDKGDKEDWFYPCFLHCLSS